MIKYTLGGERKAVQNPLITYVQEARAIYHTNEGKERILHLGWNYLTPEEALQLRGGKTGLVLRETFIEQMLDLNPGFMTCELAEELITRIETIPPSIHGNRVAWEYLRGLRTVFVPSENRERNVRFIDTDDLENNTYHVTDEYSFTNGSKTIRQDLVFIINGIPVLFVETKAASKIDGMQEALDQVKRYHIQCPELLALLQLFAITHLLKYFYSATWNTSVKRLFNWKEEQTGDFETLVKTFFDRERITRLLTECILFTTQDDELRKVVLRPHQMRAVEKVVDRALEPQKKRGLIWHTQGSGKTYTMIMAAQRIMANPLFENPTVIMLVDRNELETQLFGNISSVGIKHVEVTQSKRDLRKLLREDTRALIVTMIHKFDRMQANINSRENIFVLVDEAHRTTGGKLGNYLTGALPKASLIGFTGTPIDRTTYGKGTFIIFGRDDPPHGYLDKYGIAESIADQTTVPLNYTLAPSSLQADREVMEEEFWSLAETEGVSEVEQLNKVLEKAVTLRNMLKNSDRVERIGRFVADHFTTVIETMGYKAFLVGVDREACALYKEELDKHLPEEWSRVVYSPGHNDEDDLARHHLGEKEEKQLRKDFRNPDKLPKILIVTEKLLTGFDAPILYCMYLDKPMRDHVLLQAIARVNRPYEDDTGRKKSSGFVLDFVGIFDNLEKALAFDSQDIEGVIQDIDLLKIHFALLMTTTARQYLELIHGRTEDKRVEAVLEFFREEENRDEFTNFFRELSDMYEILSPDAFLRPYLEDFETLARMYRIMKEAYGKGVLVDKEFTRKTAKLVQEHTKSGKIKSTLEVYEINDETLKKIEESQATDTEKVFNLARSIGGFVQTHGNKSPYLISIGERAERLAEAFIRNQKTTQAALDALRQMIIEIREAQQEQAEKGMPTEVFTVYWIMKKSKLVNPEDVANSMINTFATYPHWKTSEKHEMEIRRRLYQVLLEAGLLDASTVTELAQKVLRVLKEGA